jgi:thiol-disulfide isomerase/thioredoxin
MEWTGLTIGVIALAAATAFGLFRRSGEGKVRAVTQDSPHDSAHASVLRELGVHTGTVTLLQFSSAFCAPCRATRVICADVARTTPGVSHVEVDAESHLEEVRALDIWRTPTVLIVDEAGRVVGRAQGIPTRAQVLATVTALVAPQHQSTGATQ